MWRLVVVVMLLASCGFPNREAHRNPTQPLEHQMPHRDEGKTVDRVRGVVQIGDDMFPMPVQFAAVELVHAGQVMRSTNTDHDGRFVFGEDVPLGTYEVRVAGEYVGATHIEWHGRAADELVIKARRR